MQEFESLTSLQQESYLGLYAYACDDFKRATEREVGKPWENIPKLHREVLSISAANAFNSAVFLLSSRINHSCISNIHFAYNTNLEKGTFHAVRDLQVDEELFVMYNNGTNRTRSQRQGELKKWGFLCVCPACEDTPQGNNRELKRAELVNLDQRLAMNSRFGKEESWGKALKAAQRIAAIQQSEGLLNRDLGISSVYNLGCFKRQYSYAHLVIMMRLDTA